MLADWLAAGEDVAADFGAALDPLEATLEAAEFQKMLGGEHDRANAILTINSGAGGTDSQDWAEMLLRMYLRWCDRHSFKRDLIDIQAGEEAGIKSATVIVNGEYAYGKLAAEAGRPPPGADQPLRLERAAADLLRLGVRLARDRRRRSRSTSRRRTCASTPTARAVRAASTST